MMANAFTDRAEAGRMLGERLQHLARPQPVVLALPRGGVPVASEIARTLRAPIDLLLVRKIGAPGQPELAAGAVLDGEAPRMVLNQRVVDALGMSQAEIAEAVGRETEEIERRRRAWMQGRKPIPLAGRTAIIVDDGVATGSSVEVALQAVQAVSPARLVIAMPVAPSNTAARLRRFCDEAVFLRVEPDFLSVGSYYVDFHQLDDEEMIELLDRVWRQPPRATYRTRPR
jgi:putative phosphoribosyl transferase